MAPHFVVRQETVAKVCQLTGDRDRERGDDVVNRTGVRFGIAGTDLGSSFEHDGKLWFLFGDTWPCPPGRSSHLAAVSRAPEHMECFVVGGDRFIRGRWFRDRWQNTYVLGAAFAETAGLAAVSRAPEHMEVFAVGDDGITQGRWFWNRWGGWYRLDNCTDSIASTTATDPHAVTLEFITDGAGRYRSPSLRLQDGTPLSTQCFEVPIAGFSAAGDMYVFHSTDHYMEGPDHFMGKTFLAKALGGDPANLEVCYLMSDACLGGHFINIACTVMHQGLSGLPFTGPALLAWGSGRYRHSDVYLASVPLSGVTQKHNWWFYDPKATPLPWSKKESDAAPLFHPHKVVGELSVSWVQALGLWLMLYNSPAPRGIVGRVAEAPWGPWSDPPTVVFDPRWQGVGYGHFMHDPILGDGLSDRGRESEFGGEYGPYIIDRFTRSVPPRLASRAAQIFFVMSTWNPYNVVLMTATLDITSPARDRGH